MRQAMVILGSLAAAIGISTVAYAADVVQTADGQITTASETSALQRAQLPAANAGLKTFYSTFSAGPSNAYDAASGWTVVAEAASPFGQQHVAMAFTPSESGVVKTIHVAVGYMGGNNGVTVSLNSDAQGVPGTVLHKADVIDLPQFGTCCLTSSFSTKKGARLTAGTQYWVVVKTGKKTANTSAAWNHNNAGFVGTVAFDKGSGWLARSGSVSAAFSVLGK